MDRFAFRIVALAAALCLSPRLALAQDPGKAPPKVHYVDQGPDWSSDLRALYYKINQGSELIPLSWLKALHQTNGKPFLDGSLARYGFLPTDDPAKSDDLPIGFSNNMTDQGPMVGVACSACHVREIAAGGQAYRIDGAPAMVDFVPFAVDLDAAVGRVRTDDAAFHAFAAAVLGKDATDESAVQILRASVDLWWVRYNAFITKSLPLERPWGPARMDAISLIYNRLAGLDLGPPPTYLILSNIERGNAPARYPFLWNASRQDFSQWTGFAANGNDFYALTRNLGQLYGVFGTFHPEKTAGTFTIFNRNYLAVNSADFDGLMAAENVLKRMGPPVWPWPVDRALAKQGEVVFNRSKAQGGCAECHGVREGEPRPPSAHTLATPVLDVGTDRRQWQVVMRDVQTGSMEGAVIPTFLPPLKAKDKAISLLRVSVLGAVGDLKKGDPLIRAQKAKSSDPAGRIKASLLAKVGLSLKEIQASIEKRLGFGPKPPPPLIVNAYEARVLKGIWAAAPYLHNGSVPSLEELLKPPAQRVRSFKVGPGYDPVTVGLATDQTATDFTLHTTGCEDLNSGDSNCGHDYGTALPPDDKRALLEFLKTF